MAELSSALLKNTVLKVCSAKNAEKKFLSASSPESIKN